MRILAEPSATRDVVEANLPNTTATLFRAQMLPELWSAAVRYAIDPVGMVAQAGKETAWGSYPGRVQPWFYNTAGIKVRHVSMVMTILETNDTDHPLVHQQFPSWEVGALAHAQHLRAYCNRGVIDLVVDPRYGFVLGNHNVVTWSDLGGKWAPSPTYGVEIEAIMATLQGAT